MRMLRRIGLVLSVLILLGVTLAYVVAQLGQQDLTAEIRAALPGRFFETSHGVVSYELRGPPTGHVVVLVHGMTTPKFVWNAHVGPLAQAGYRVLRYDLWGRGFSDRPEVVYDADLYDRQLLALLEGLELARPVSLVGYSLGGAIATTFAARHPESVRSLVVVAPAGFEAEPNRLVRFLFAPVIGEWFATVVAPRLIRGAFRTEIEAGVAPSDMVALWEEQYRFRGYSRAILSTARSFSNDQVRASYETVGRHDIPTTAIWGTEDELVPFAGSEALKRAIPSATVAPIEGAGHSVTYTRAGVVNDLILGALARRSAPSGR